MPACTRRFVPPTVTRRSALSGHCVCGGVLSSRIGGKKEPSRRELHRFNKRIVYFRFEGTHPWNWKKNMSLYSENVYPLKTRDVSHRKGTPLTRIIAALLVARANKSWQFMQLAHISWQFMPLAHIGSWVLESFKRHLVERTKTLILYTIFAPLVFISCIGAPIFACNKVAQGSKHEHATVCLRQPVRVNL